MINFSIKRGLNCICGKEGVQFIFQHPSNSIIILCKEHLYKSTDCYVNGREFLTKCAVNQIRQLYSQLEYETNKVIEKDREFRKVSKKNEINLF